MKRIQPILRFLRHIFIPHWRVKQAFSHQALRNIEHAITASETRHSGQIRFAVEANLSLHQLLCHFSPKKRAIQVFSDLRVWDTAQNNGVLIYLLMADRDVEIVADRGIHQQVGSDGWEAICKQMESQFKLGHFEVGVLEGIESISRHLTQFSPPAFSVYKVQKNELSDQPVIL